MSSAFSTERVLSVHHWNDTLFSFRCTRDAALRFRNGHFVMIGLPVNGKPLLRAYSIASCNYEEHLEFLSIKVQDGPLTSRLQHLKVGDELIVSRKPVGTLVIDDLTDGDRLWLFSTGTGLAPFMSIVKDPATYERFRQVILVHGVRRVSDLAYHRYLHEELPADELLGEMAREQLVYWPTVTREPFEHEGAPHQGRIPTLIEEGTIVRALDGAAFSPERDRAMLCGSTAFLNDMRALLDARGFVASPSQGTAGQYVFERAFVS